MSQHVDQLVIQDNEIITMFDIRHLSQENQDYLLEWLENELRRLTPKTVELTRGTEYVVSHREEDQSDGGSRECLFD